MLDPTAHVSTTRGGDGRIDVFVNALSGSFLGEDTPTPCVIECKWNDPNAGNTEANITAGWAAVRKALAKAAAGGWAGRFEPWRRARGYGYCISGRFPATDVRDRLREAIRAFFEGLPEAQRLPIAWVEVLDWSNLREQFDISSRLRDAWLGLDHSALRPQDEYEAGLQGFRGFLLEGRLAFVPPAEAAPAHPARILERLGRLSTDQRGVLLAGAGGVGKTRTALEVARLATLAGWRVLHATGTDGLSLDALGEAVLPAAAGTSVLLCLDYLEQFVGLDPNALRTRLAAGVSHRGGRLAVLATARLSAAEQYGNRWTSYFDRVELEPDAAQRARIIGSMLAVAAPGAIDRYGEEMLRAAVGQRPIIALLVARAIEALHAEAGAAGIEPLLAAARGRQPDLRYWLQSRLREDHLLPGQAPPRTAFLPEPAAIDVSLVAAAAALAALPLVNWKVEQVAASALPGADAAARARLMRESLARFGWTDDHDNYVCAAHDVVADEVLAGCVLDAATGAVRTTELARILATGLEMPRVVGRHAMALSRAFQGATAEPAVIEAYAAWLTSNAATLGVALANAAEDEGGYAIGALLGTPFAAEAAEAVSRDLVTPWLVRHGLRREAYHVLGRALRRPEPGDNVLRLGFGWVGRYGTAPEASHVLAPLLGRESLGAADATRAIAAAFAWLDHPGQGTKAEARFVLHPLLGRKDLGAADATRAIAAAFAWLDHPGQGATAEASHVLAPLLGRESLGAADATRAIAAAFAWLDHPGQGTTAEASHVLAPLLGLGTADATRAIAAAFAWLDHPGQGTKAEAQFVLHALLGRKDLGAADATRAIAAAFAWLDHPGQGTTAEASHVLPPLLGRKDLGAADATRAIAAAFAWLDHPGQGTTAEASHVLPPLLGRKHLGAADATRAIAAAFAWLDHPGQGTTADASHVLPPLLGQTAVQGDLLMQALQRSVRWLRHDPNGTMIDASHVLKRMLARGRDLGEQESETVALAVVWARARWRDADSDYVMGRILRRPSPEREAWRAIAARALLHQRRRRSGKDASMSAALLARPDELREATRGWLVREFLRLAPLPGNEHVALSHGAGLALGTWLAAKALRPPRYSAAVTGLICCYVESRWSGRPDDQRDLGDILALALPIAGQCDDASVGDRFHRLVRRWLAAFADHAEAMSIFAGTAWALLDLGAWRDAAAGHGTLAALGVPEPGNRSPGA